MVSFLRDFLTFHWLVLGASETVLGVFGVTAGGLGDGFSITGASGIFFALDSGTTAVLAAGLGDGVPADAGGPGKDTKLTLIDPGENRRLGAESGKNTIYPIKPK